MEEEFEKFANNYVLKLEKKRAKKAGLIPPKKTDDFDNNGKNHCGYDIESEDRHIEVKSFTKKRTYKELTSRQTQAMLKDKKFYLYIVEKNSEHQKPDVFAIPRNELKKMNTMLQVARINGIQNHDKKEGWRIK